MIFRPRHEINIFGIKIIGLIPKRQAAIASNIAETVENELISHKDIRRIIQTEEFLQRMNEGLKKSLDTFIMQRIDASSFLTLFMPPEMMKKITDLLMDELQKDMPGIIDNLFEVVEEKINFRKIIEDKINGFDLSKLEKIINKIAAKELKAIELMGGLLGFVVGIVQDLIMFAGHVYG